MVQVAPSILAANFATLQQDCEKVVSAENPLLHFDVMDGVFVPNISVGLPVLQSLHSALPAAVYDVHLMILRPLQYAEAFIKAGASMLTFHIEAESPVAETTRQIRALGCKAGLSLRPGTPVETLFPLLKEVDYVLVMSVEPGFGGQKFIPESLEKITKLRREAQRQNLPGFLIEVDGGIDLQTAPACVQAGADILVAGSAVFGSQNPGQAVELLRRAGEKEKV